MNRQDLRKPIRGFTLIELALVLVIVGLIVSLVTAAQSLIRSAAMRAIASEVEQIKSSINTFRLKYGARPGDLPNASSYWPNCDTTTPADCDGNKDGKITGDEQLRAWQQLGDAGLIDGIYTGELDSSKMTIGVNVPPSDVSPGGYLIRSITSAVWGKSGIVIEFGSEDNNNMSGQIITAEEAFSLDTKMDDDYADKGEVFTLNGFNGGTELTTCVDGAEADASATYITDQDDPVACRMYFWLP